MNRTKAACVLAVFLTISGCAGATSSPRAGNAPAPGASHGSASPAGAPAQGVRALALPDGNAHPRLPGVTVGLLVLDNGAWGASAPGPNASHEGEYEFHGPPGSAFWVPYFPSAGEGKNFMRDFNPDGATDGPAGSYDCAMFGPRTANPWRLERDVHLVEIEVNRGRGSVANTMHFVGTRVRVLDGTSEYPFRPGEVLRSLRASYDAWLASAQPRIDAALAKARVTPPPELGPWSDEKESRDLGAHITWNAETKRMIVLFHTHVHRDRWADHSREPGFRPSAGCSHLGRCGSRFSVALGQESEVDGQGRIVGTTDYGPATSLED